MSLTDHLKWADSAVRVFLEGAFPLVGQAKGPSRQAKAAAESLGLDAATALERFVTLSADLPLWASPVGTAFDYRVRMTLGDFDLDASMARARASISMLPPDCHEFEIFRQAFEVARYLLQGDDEADYDRASVVLAWCESLVRSQMILPGGHVIFGSLGKAVRAAPDGASLVQAIPPSVLDDLQQLRNVGGALQIAAWRSEIQGGARYVPNPMFSGGEVVDGADGDWIVGDTLVDCKTTSELNRTKLRGYLLQLLGYVLLDENDDLGIRQVAVWLPRYGRTLTWRLSELLGADPDQVLPTLREDFIRVMRNPGHAVALHKETLTEKRVTGLIAENKHTASESLDTMASSAEVAVRAKAAGNPNTPVQTLIRLSSDGRAEVRAKVAGNPSTPEDVWERLMDDRSVTVYLAAGGARRPVPESAAQPVARRRSSRVAAKPRLRNRTGLLGYWELYWLEKTEHAEYLDYHWELFGFQPAGIPDSLSIELRALRRVRHEDGDVCTAEHERLSREFDPERWEMADRMEAERLVVKALEGQGTAPGALVPARVTFAWTPSAPSQGELLLAASRDMSLSEVERANALDRLSSSDRVGHREDAARSPHADMQMLLRLSMDKRAEVRAAVSRNQQTPAWMLEFLTGERSVRVRRSALGNANLPERVLRSLSADSDDTVRCGVASHVNTPTDLLVQLTDSDSLLVTLFAVLNPSTPIDTLQVMRDDSDPLVRKVVAATLVYRESAGDEVAEDVGVRAGS